MLYKNIVPCSQDLKGESPVEILKISSKGLDKTASMQKRAAAFKEEIADLKPLAKKAYLHVITTGASEVFGPNRNCFVAGTKVITETGVKNIEQICPGDLVKTGQGTFKPVLKTFSRAYTGPLVSIKAQGLPDYVTMTADHPVFKVPKKQWLYLYQKYSHKACDYEAFLNQLNLLAENKSFFTASTLQSGDRLMLPSTETEHTLEQLQPVGYRSKSKDFSVAQNSLQFAYCLGLWLAQGCVSQSKNKKDKYFKSVIYTLHTTNDLQSIQYLKRFAEHGGFRVGLRKTTSSIYTINVQISSNKLASRFVQLVGRGAKKKFIHPSLYCMPIEWKKAFLCGYIDGDGALKKGKQLGGIHISTASLSLAYDVQDMLAGLGIKAAISHGYNKTQNGCFGKKTTDIYAVTIASSLTEKLLTYTKRIPCIPYIKKAKRSSKNVLVNKKLFTKVLKVKTTEAVQPVTVYNIQVEQQHTYCVPFVVHNCDSWNQSPYDFQPPLAKKGSICHVGEGLKKYHKTYLDGAHVYQEHQTDEEPSGIVKAAVYNQNMHRGQLLIEVDTDKWAARLHKKASGQDIYLSVGANLKQDLCTACGNAAHTLDEHCEHIKKHAGMILQDGTKIAMINPQPKFYDISGVNVPADAMAYVLRKVASGASAKETLQNKYLMNMTRPAMQLDKVASMLSKLSAIEKRLICKSQDDPLFTDEDDAVKQFLHAVENYDSDQIIDQCNRKAILLSPEMLFKIIGKDSPQKELFDTYAENCPCDCQHLMQDMEMDPMFKKHLTDGSFDTVLPADLNLANILEAFVPDFGVSRPAVNGRSIRIQIHMSPKPMKGDNKELEKKLEQKSKDKEQEDKEEDQDIQKKASMVNDEFRRTYARYVLSFASRNNQDTCNLAMQKLARYRTVNA